MTTSTMSSPSATVPGVTSTPSQAPTPSLPWVTEVTVELT